MARAPEYRLQMAVKSYLDMALPGDVVWYHVPNGEKHDKRTGAKLKAMGVKAGVPDLAFVLPPAGQAAFIELKTEDGDQSSNQTAFRLSVRQAGGLEAVARSVEEVESVLRRWGVALRATTGAWTHNEARARKLTDGIRGTTSMGMGQSVKCSGGGG